MRQVFLSEVLPVCDLDCTTDILKYILFNLPVFTLLYYTGVLNHDPSFTKVSLKYQCCSSSLKLQIWRCYKDLNSLMNGLFATSHAFSDIWWNLQKKENPQSKLCWENLWNIFFFIFHVFAFLILSKFSVMLVKFAKNGCRNDILPKNFNTFGRIWQNLPILQTYWKCSHFFVF